MHAKSKIDLNLLRIPENVSCAKRKLKPPAKGGVFSLSRR